MATEGRLVIGTFILSDKNKQNQVFPGNDRVSRRTLATLVGMKLRTLRGCPRSPFEYSMRPTIEARGFFYLPARICAEFP